MWPLQNKATKSMKKMQALTPMMNGLKVKYKDDPARMNQELMKLYKDYQINPLVGCLPMLIQIPSSSASSACSARRSSCATRRFLWVHDLSQSGYRRHILLFQPSMSCRSAWRSPCSGR